MKVLKLSILGFYLIKFQKNLLSYSVKKKKKQYMLIREITKIIFNIYYILIVLTMFKLSIRQKLV